MGIFLVAGCTSACGSGSKLQRSRHLFWRSSLRHAGLLLAAYCTAATATVLAADPDQAPPFEVTLRPIPDASGIGIEAVAVKIRIDPAGEAKPKMRLQRVANNVETIASSLSHIAAEDSVGPLPLVVEHEGPADAGTRLWTPVRRVEDSLTLRYLAPLESRLAPRGAAPPLELRGGDGSFSGAGSTFLLLPEGDKARRIRIHWDLTALPANARAVSNFDASAGQASIIAPASALERAFFMAGVIGYYPESPSGGHFRAAWQGAPPFDANELMAWTSLLQERYIGFFKVANPATYTVFLRPNPINPGGGVGLADAFVATFDEKTEGEALKLTLAHEMFHTFAPSISNPGGLESSWFGEGLATHYQRVLPFRFGQIGAERFLESLNSTAARYYTSAMAEVPNSEVPGRFWEDTRIRTLPYDRGALYFAELDHRLRKQTGGERSLDDLLLKMVERQRSGKMLSYRDWEELLIRELGPEGVQHFRDMLAGRPPLPASEAFGPCFRRTQRLLRRYELGFDPKVLVEPRRIVRGLTPSSAADRAGLRNGDEIVRPVPQDRIQGDQEALLHLEVRRGETVLPITYLPRGERVQAWQWELARAPNESCRI